MLYPSIDSLQEKVESKYRLAILVSKRVHDMEQSGNFLLEKYNSKKNIGKALEEVYEDKITYKTE